jgi:predicted Zn-dependent protease
MLAPAEAAKLDALRIRVVAVKPGDSEQSLARRMRGVDRPLELFRTLNDLRPGEVLPVGTKVKIVED